MISGVGNVATLTGVVDLCAWKGEIDDVGQRMSVQI